MGLTPYPEVLAWLLGGFLTALVALVASYPTLFALNLHAREVR